MTALPRKGDAEICGRSLVVVQVERGGQVLYMLLRDGDGKLTIQLDAYRLVASFRCVLAQSFGEARGLPDSFPGGK